VGFREKEKRGADAAESSVYRKGKRKEEKKRGEKKRGDLDLAWQTFKSPDAEGKKGGGGKRGGERRFGLSLK